MPSTPLPLPAAIPAIQTRPQLEILVENIIQLQLSRAELLRFQNREIASIREKYRASLAELDHFLTLELSWAEAWARENPSALGAARSVSLIHGVLGFHTSPPEMERASRRWTWSRIASTLSELPWGQRYLRQPEPEVDKEALTADLALLDPERLREAGIKIVQGERFYVAPLCETNWEVAA